MKTFSAALLLLLLLAPAVLQAEEPAAPSQPPPPPPTFAPPPPPALPTPVIVNAPTERRDLPPPTLAVELPSALATGARRIGFGFAQLTGTNIGFATFLNPALALDLNLGFQVALAETTAIGFSLAPGIYSYLGNTRGRAVTFLHGYLELTNPIGKALADSRATVGLNFGAEFFLFRELSVSGELGVGVTLAQLSPFQLEAGTTGRGVLGANFYF